MDVYEAVTSRRAVRGFTDEGLILFCGMSIGHEDPAVTCARTGRAPLDETVMFVDG
jgi:hypothetical protein